jgi:polyhydroxybutyrate depolymerase
MFAHRLACELPGTLAAIAPVAGALPAAIVPRCADAPSLSVLAIQGTDDRLVPYDGGGVAAVRGAVLSAQESVAHWARRAGCGPPAEVERIDRVQDGTALIRHAHAGCGARALELYEIRGGGHTWPGGPRVVVPRLGRTTRELDGTRAIWDFFAAHPREAAAQR